MINVEKATVKLKESTLKDLLRAVEKARKEIDFTTDPLPDSDMSMEQWKQELKKRGKLTVSNGFSPVVFEIDLEIGPSEEESMGPYELE